MANRPAGAALALIVGALAPVAAAHGFPLPWSGHAAAHRFTFPYAAHIDVRSGNAAAKAFVEKELPAGLPMAEAVAKARAARSSCHNRGSDVVCRYTITEAPDMAPLGQEIWTLTLTPGPDGKLATAAIDRRHAGLPGEAGDRAVFHWRLGE